MSKILIIVAVIAIALIFFRKRKAAEPVDEKQNKELEKAVEMKQDPVCGSYVEETTRYKVKYYDKIFYFCSEECKDKFIATKQAENKP